MVRERFQITVLLGGGSALTMAEVEAWMEGLVDARIAERMA